MPASTFLLIIAIIGACLIIPFIAMICKKEKTKHDITFSILAIIGVFILIPSTIIWGHLYDLNASHLSIKTVYQNHLFLTYDICPNCNSAIGKHEAYCEICGTNILPVCQNCGATMDKYAYYCTDCGTYLYSYNPIFY